MAFGLIGLKIGMTRLFTSAGETVPVTVLHVPVNKVAQLKTMERDGYAAVQLAMGECKPGRLNRPRSGHLRAAGIAPTKVLREFRIGGDAAEIKGKEFSVSFFSEKEKVHITGVTKGKGFAGVVKRYNFKMQDATHGNSLAHRAPGSIGQCQDPGKVFKGKKMAGHMGCARMTTRNLLVAKVDSERELLLVRGAVPGSKGGVVTITPAVSRNRD